MARARCGALLVAAAAVSAQTNVLYPITADMSAAASAVIAYATTPGPESTLIWDRLAEMTDTFGGRLGGSASLEAALDWMRDTARNADGLTVTEHDVSVPYWSRGDEWARMISPRNKSLHFLGLGMSIGTGGAVITADVLVVASFAELDAVNASVPGKIVLFNPPWVSYGVTVAYRSQCAVAAAKYNAVAALIKSVGPYGLQTPHTGGSQTAAIPAGAVSMEDASQMARMTARGQRVTVQLAMGAQQLPDAPSRNLLIDLPGSTKPDEYVIISGHADSWDVSEGAMDDGGGAFAAWHAVRLLQRLGVKPARTIRAVLWTNEENGAAGGKGYARDYAATLNATSIAIEADEGPFTPFQLAFSGHPAAQRQLQVLAALLAPIGAGNVSSPGGGTDIGPMCALGVPCAGLEVLDPRLSPFTNNPCLGFAGASGGGATNQISDGYFWFHHTAADTIDRVDPTQLNLLAASLAIWAIAIADLPELLPRSGTVPDLPSGGGGGGDGSGTAGKVAAGVGVTAALLAAVVVVLYRLRLSAWWAHRRGGHHLDAVVATSASHGGAAESYEQLSAPLGHGGHSTTI